MGYNSLLNFYKVQRDLKRYHSYSIMEQEEMMPFERSILLDMIQAERMKDADVPDEGWKEYANQFAGIDVDKQIAKGKKVEWQE